MAPARPSLNVPRARRALRTGLAGAAALLAVAAAARLVWPSGLHLAFIPDDAGNALGTAEATGDDFPEDVTVPSILPILGLRALSSLVRRKMDLDAGEDWATGDGRATGGHRADDGGSGGNRAVGGRAGDGRPGDGRLSAGRRVAVVLHLAVAALVLCLGGRAAAVCARRWDTIARATGIGVTELLLIALMVIGLALAAAAGALSNALHTAHGDDPSPGGRWRPARWAAIAAPTLAAVLVLAGSAAVVQLRSPEDAPAIQRTAVGLPANPTSFSPEPAWSRDIAELTDVVAGAAGPLILTPDGLQGLDPADGSPTWTFRRENITLACPEEDAEKPVVGDRPCLITSPDRSYAALRLLGPGAFLKGAPEYQTVVLDTVSGSPVMEHLSEGGRLQLTDDAVLDGRSAYSLKDGSLMWTLPEEDDYPRPDHYTGPAGHSSFVLELSDPSQDEGSGAVTTTLTVAPESDPAAARTVDGVLATVHYHLVLSNGWGAVLADGGARAVGLDALAGVEGADTATADLGPAVAVNGRASLSTNLLVTVPPPPEGTRWEIDSYDPPGPDPGMVAAVFDPATGAVTDAARTPGLAAARVGIALHEAGDGVETRLTITPGDGGAGVSLPVDGTTSCLAPGRKSFNPWLADLERDRLNHGESGITALGAPGVTLVVQITGESVWSRNVRLLAFSAGAP